MTDTQHHRELEQIAAWEDFYVTLRKRLVRQVAAFRSLGRPADQLGRFVELLLFLPDLLHLSARLVFDGEVPAKRKGALIAGVAYVLSPIDLIPDTLPLLGWLDDMVVVTLALNHFLATSDPAMKQAIDRHWTGDQDLFELLKHVLEVGESAIEFLPNQFIKLLKPIFGEMRPGG
jgi:uncharacterized membrane protein YkvA (DUF1232 family)